jgi:hypothetical protein
MKILLNRTSKDAMMKAWLANVEDRWKIFWIWIWMISCKEPNLGIFCNRGCNAHNMPTDHIDDWPQLVVDRPSNCSIQLWFSQKKEFLNCSVFACGTIKHLLLLQQSLLYWATNRWNVRRASNFSRSAMFVNIVCYRKSRVPEVSRYENETAMPS